MSDQDNVRVAIRVRPLSPKEDKKPIWKVKDSKYITSGSDNFYFDRVFNANEDNHIVYSELCQPIVESVIAGFNGTIFAYGQTGTGKSYTMIGEHGGITQGVLQYAIEEIFDRIQEMPDKDFLLRVSAMEIYNEKVCDLFGKKKDLIMRDNKDGFVRVIDLEEKIVQTPEQIFELICEALNRRRVGRTDINERSSRSHFIFRMILESSFKDEDTGVTVSQLNLVDLAGSENAKKARTDGDRLKEGIHINKSLSELSQVISQLVEKQADQFINYRNSKLTRLLQNSLGGNANTAIICTVNPAVHKETLSTLYFALNAKKVKNKPTENKIYSEEALLKKYANQIKKLSEELEASKEQGKALEEKTLQNQNLKKQIEILKANFVNQTGRTKAKASRRETWGGHLDARHFFGPRSYQLPLILEEETEKDVEFPDPFADSSLKQISRHRSSASLSSNHFSDSKSNQDAETQTDPKNFEQNTEFEEAMILVSELKNELKVLQSEFYELSEYTTLERQMLKAENELQVEIEILKKENFTLKAALECKSLDEKSAMHEIKEKSELCSSENMTLKSNNNELNPETSKLIVIESSNQLNSSFNSQKCGSTLLDESMKSNFLAFYDECMENDEISKLNSEIESLKYDIEIKDKQLSLLNDKLSIKEQYIVSLKEEIDLNQNVDSTKNLVNELLQTSDILIENMCQKCSVEQHNAASLSEEIALSQNVSMPKTLVDQSVQTSNIITKERCNKCYMNNDSSSLNEFENEDEMINLLDDDMPIEQQHIVSLKEEIALTESVGMNKILVDQSVQTSETHFEDKYENEIEIKDRKLSLLSDKLSIKEQYISSLKEEIALSQNVDLPKSLVDESVQTPEVLNQEKCLKCSAISIPDSANEREKDGNIPDEIKSIISKIKYLKDYTSNFMQKCTKHKYLRNIAIIEPVQSTSESTITELSELENLIMSLEFYVRRVDEECELINIQFGSRYKELLSLGSKLSRAEKALEDKESELSNLRQMFFDLKHNFSQLNFLCQELSSVKSEEELEQLEKLVTPLDSPHEIIPEYEMASFKKLFIKLNSSMKENALKIISLTENLEKVQRDLSVSQKEKDSVIPDFSSSELKNSHSKSTQTCRLVDAADSVEEDILRLKNEIKSLQEENNNLEQIKEEWKQKVDELYVTRSEAMDSLEKDFEYEKSLWNVKMEMLIKDLEEKYDKELNDQEIKLSEEYDAKILKLKQDYLKQMNDLKEEIDDMKIAQEELAHSKQNLEKEIASESSEKQELKIELQKKEEEIQALRLKHSAQLRKCKDVNTQLKTRVRCHLEEIEKLKKENMSGNNASVFEKLSEKLNEVLNEKDELQKKCLEYEQHVSKLKGQVNYLDYKLKKIKEEERAKQSTDGSNKEIEETNKKLLYDVDQKKAKIMSLEANNESLVQEVKKLKDMLSSKTANCKCKNSAKNSKPDIPETHELKKEKKQNVDGKHNLEVAQEHNAKKLSNDVNPTPKQTDCAGIQTPTQQTVSCEGGGSGPANMVKNYWLEGIVHKKDREIQKLRQELGDLNSQLKKMKMCPKITEEKQSKAEEKQPKKPELRSLCSPLQELQEDVTVQVNTYHPYHGNVAPKMPKKQTNQRNGPKINKPYERPDFFKNENVPPERELPDSDLRRPEIKTKKEAISALTDPECKQQ